MSDTTSSLDPRFRQRSPVTAVNEPDPRDGDNISLVLRPAEFDDEPHAAATPDAPSNDQVGPSRQSRSHSAAGPRGPAKRRELVELAGNPFVLDPHSPRADGQPPYRQDIYPAYDASGRRIGLEHVRNASGPPEGKGYYRKHVHEYDSARGAPLPIPSQVPVHSNYPEQGPLPPVSAVIAGIPPESQYGIGTFSHIQNRPRTPHEVLGLPSGAPLNLWSLLDPDTPDAKPQYNYHVLVKLAILGNKGQKATLQDILRAIRLRFPYYENLQRSEAIAFGNSIRHLLSLLAAFVREPKPVTEPGKGAYWKVDFSKGEGNKRVRKRNKPQKKVDGGQRYDKQDKQGEENERNSRSGSDDSQPSASASTQASSKSPVSQSFTETQLHTSKVRGGGKGGRKPAPKNLISTPNGGTVVVAPPSAGASQEDFYARLDPALMNNAAAGPASQPHAASEPYLQLHPSNVGAHRERITRGAARCAPYPSTLVMPRSASASGRRSGSRSGSSEHDYQYSSTSPVDAPHRNERHSSASPISGGTPPPHERQHNQKGYSGSSAYRDYEHRDPAHMPHRSYNDGGHYGRMSPQESPMSDQQGQSDQSVHPTSGSSQLPNQLSRSPAPFDIPSSPATNYGLPPLANPSTMPGPSSAVSHSSSYGFARYAERRHTAEIDTMFTTMQRPRVERHHDNEAYANASVPHSVRNPANSPRARR